MSEFTFSSAMANQLEADAESLQANINQPKAGAKVYQDILSDISQTGIVTYEERLLASVGWVEPLRNPSLLNRNVLLPQAT